MEFPSVERKTKYGHVGKILPVDLSFGRPGYGLAVELQLHAVDRGSDPNGPVPDRDGLQGIHLATPESVLPADVAVRRDPCDEAVARAVAERQRGPPGPTAGSPP
jgi:hypothetical protein